MKEIIIDGVDVSGCNCFIEKMDFPNNLEGGYYNQNNLCKCGVQGVESYPFFCKDNPNCNYKQLKRKEQECEELRRSITKIFACLIKANRTNKIVDTIWVNRITTLWDYIALTLGIEGDQTQIEEQIYINPLITEEEPTNKYKQAFDEIIRFFKEDEKFARYSGRPIIFAKPALEKIEKILKENDIKIS